MLMNPGNGGTIGDADLLESRLTAYRLMTSSALIDAGLDLTAAPFSLSVGDTDFYGVPIPQGEAFDLGANEVPEPTAAMLLGLPVGVLLLRRGRPRRG